MHWLWSRQGFILQTILTLTSFDSAISYFDTIDDLSSSWLHGTRYEKGPVVYVEIVNCFVILYTISLIWNNFISQQSASYRLSMSQEQGSFNTMSLAQEATLINCNSQVYRQQPRKLDQQVLLSQSQVSLSKRNSTESYFRETFVLQHEEIWLYQPSQWN